MITNIEARIVFNAVPTLQQYAPYAIGMHIADRIKKSIKKKTKHIKQ